ncbi:hypothetical protein TIFTF001_026376 [Ficus carica]|uniref:WAT1-related protein n=1 Tax=Ficus carica TaxID=3494 RepID=A0AA88DL24_FICCA|nr:hypothetical protein TIFTF001_026376 [Ficus carica]
MSTKSLSPTLKPIVGIILLQFGYAGLSIFSKSALNKGISPYVLVVYRHAIAAAVISPFAIVLERKTRPKMTASVFAKIMLLALLEPVIDQNLFYTGMKFTTATFATALWNVLPVFTFVMAWIFRLEKVSIGRVHSQVKVLGTIVTVGGAMIMTVVDGPVLNFPWSSAKKGDHTAANATNDGNSVKGAIMIAIGSVSSSCFLIIQAITLKSYPAEITLTALICLMGAIEGTIAALVLEWRNPAAWSMHFNSMLGIVCSGFAYYVQGMAMKEKGPVFVTAFLPLNLVIVAILSSSILAETMYLGMVIGAVLIVVGIYMVLWGKSKDQLPCDSSNQVSAPKDENTKSSNQSV